MKLNRLAFFFLFSTFPIIAQGADNCNQSDSTKAVTFLEKRLAELRSYAKTRHELQKCQAIISSQNRQIADLRQQLTSLSNRFANLETVLIEKFAINLTDKASDKLVLFKPHSSFILLMDRTIHKHNAKQQHTDQ